MKILNNDNHKCLHLKNARKLIKNDIHFKNFFLSHENFRLKFDRGEQNSIRDQTITNA